MKINEINDIIQFLFENTIPAHIDTLDNIFYNGLIIEIKETFIVVEDRINGKLPIAISEIKTIEKFREVGE